MTEQTAVRASTTAAQPVVALRTGHRNCDLGAGVDGLRESVPFPTSSEPVGSVYSHMGLDLPQRARPCCSAVALSFLEGSTNWFTLALATRTQSSRPHPAGADEGQVTTTDHLANDLACLE